MSDSPEFIVAAFYLFESLPGFEDLQDPLLAFCRARDLRGSILLAPEGINGTVGGSKGAIDELMDYLRSQPGLAELREKRSFADGPIQRRMKVRLKREIVTFDMPDFDPGQRTGTYVEPSDWNDLISRDDVLLIDTRNDYEVDVGTFEGAVNPNTRSFRDFIDYTREKLDPGTQPVVAMFCTGGIRCEKASAYLLDQGFEQVFHLKGGILQYLEDVPKQDSKWEGECFVFDERVTVDHDLHPGSFDMCRACRNPISVEDMQHPQFEEGVSCKHCFDRTSEERKERFRERERQVKLAKKRGETHIGD